MTVESIPTPSLDLVFQTPDEVLAWVVSLPLDDRAEVSPDWIARVRQTVPGEPWSLAFKVVNRATRAMVGTCAFKGPPGTDRIVEVAYGIDLAHRGREFATEAAQAVTRFALNSGIVRLVRDHSRPENSASARVLEKC